MVKVTIAVPGSNQVRTFSDLVEHAHRTARTRGLAIRQVEIATGVDRMFEDDDKGSVEFSFCLYGPEAALQDAWLTIRANAQGYRGVRVDAAQ